MEDSSLDFRPWVVTEMGKLGPSSLGHIYREGRKKSLRRSVLSGVPGAVSTGSWETPDASHPTPGSVMALWELRVGHGGNIYTTEVNKCCRQRIFSRDQSVHFLLLGSTLPNGILRPVMHLCLCLSCRSGAEAEGWRSPLWGESGSEAPRTLGHSEWLQVGLRRGNCCV